MRPAPSWARVLLLAGLLVGCAEEGRSASTAEDSSPLPNAVERGPGGPATGSPSSTPEKRRRREPVLDAQERKRCRTLLRGVHLGYTITASPAAHGQRIGLRMRVDNRTDAKLSGDTWGRLRVSPGRWNGISWGGSSSDVVWQLPHTSSDREVWHDRRPPGWHPVGRRVTGFTFYAYTYAPGRPLLTCAIPARIVAPRGLVTGHRSGHWTQRPEK